VIPAPTGPAHVVGFLGSTLDRGGQRRWERWRPTVDLCRHPDLIVGRFDLLYTAPHQALLEEVVTDIAAISPETVVHPHPVAFEDAWDFEEVYETMHAWVQAARLEPGPDGPLVHITTGSHVMQICWFLLTESGHLPGRLLQTAPPRRDDRGPGAWTIIDLDLSRYDRIARRFAHTRAEGLSFLKDGIDTRNPRFNELIGRIEAVAIASREPILLLGPTGAGKTRLARRIHALKQARKQVKGALVEVNCATLRGDQAMSALFGHERGAFTGAIGPRPGLLREADSGVLFLDEVAELGPDEQAMLLRAVEDQTFLPVGADKPVRSNFQLIAGTNVDLLARVQQGLFRRDLLARIDLWTFELPGLAQRPEDLEPNLDHELERMSEETGRLVSFNREARERFLALGRAPWAVWEGNFRDLRAAVTRMATLSAGGRIGVSEVEEELARLRRRWGRSDPQPGADLTDLLGEAAARLDRFDRVQLTDVVAVCRQSGSLAEAGRVLFAESFKERSTRNDGDRLRKYLARFDLSWEMLHQAAHEVPR
jgi:transcriptional regulatory protein RtcR